MPHWSDIAEQPISPGKRKARVIMIFFKGSLPFVGASTTLYTGFFRGSLGALPLARSHRSHCFTAFRWLPARGGLAAP